MTKAIRIFETGGPEVMQLVDVDVPAPGPGEARIRQHAIGLNYIDVYFRSGLYPQPLPGVSAWRLRAWWRPWARA